MRKKLNISKNEIWISRNLTFNYVTHVRNEAIQYNIISFYDIWNNYNDIKNAQTIDENSIKKIPNNSRTFSKYGERFQNSYSKTDLICKVEVLS